jgi:hypothetical protein
MISGREQTVRMYIVCTKRTTKMNENEWNPFWFVFAGEKTTLVERRTIQIQSIKYFFHFLSIVNMLARWKITVEIN